MNRVTEDFLMDLETLKQDLDSESSRDAIRTLKYETSKEYIMGLRISKPETLLSDKFLKPLMASLELVNFPEGRVNDGWVDFLITGSKNTGLPVALELKALHSPKGNLRSLEEDFNGMKRELASKGRNQIINYLMGPGGHAYVVLTNMSEVYLFDKSAVVHFEPFLKLPFSEFVESISVSRNIWDVIRRKDEEISRADLDKIFIKDLQRWNHELQKLHWKSEPAVNSVLFLNKMIMALTLEDYNIVKFRNTWDTFSEVEARWRAKGSKKIATEFMHSLDDFLFSYYDTELFDPSNSALHKLEETRESYDDFLDTIKKVVGIEEKIPIFTEGLYSYNFRYIDEDVFGKSYETFLAEERKDLGIYYTPKEITKHMAKLLVEDLFSDLVNRILDNIDKDEFEIVKKDVQKLKNIVILDPACGSGPFLISVMREIYSEYDKLDEGTKWTEDLWGERRGTQTTLSPAMGRRYTETKGIRVRLGVEGTPKRQFISELILRHICGVDIDSTALNVAKANVWKEAVKMKPEDFYYLDLPEDENHVLPDLDMNFRPGNSLVSLPIEHTIEILAENYTAVITQMHELRDKYLLDPKDPTIVAKIEELKRPLRDLLESEFSKDHDIKTHPLFYPLEFFFLYFDKSGHPLPEAERGFHGLIGNPPWNNVKPSKKEFAARHPEIFGTNVSKFSISGKEFEKIFGEHLKVPSVNSLWDNYSSEIHSLSRFISSEYHLQYSGDISLQKTFLERFMQLSRNAFSILVPSNFHTDEGTVLLRKEIIENWGVSEFISFENRGKVWFRDLDSRFKFDMLTVSRTRRRDSFDALFYVTDFSQLSSAFAYPIELIPKLSPAVFGLVEFRSKDDIEIVMKIRDNHALLRDLGIRIIREMDETNDKDIFNTDGEGLIAYEGKMIHQYNSNYAKSTYWIVEKQARERLLNKQAVRIIKTLRNKLGRNQISAKLSSGEWRFDYEASRFCFRGIGRSTDERTLISTIIPPKVFLMNSLPYIEPFKYELDGDVVHQRTLGDYLYYLEALFNSFVLDYYIRQRVSANLNFFFIYELPIPKVDSSLLNTIIEKAKEFSRSHTVSLRSEIELLIARDVFGLNRMEIQHILKSFVYGNIDQDLVDTIVGGS